MDITIQQRQGAVSLQLNGSLDIYTSLDLKTKIEETVETYQKALIIDLTNVEYVDSSGIGTLIKGLNITKEKDVAFAIVGVQPSIEKVFKVAGLLSFFTILTQKEYDEQYPASE